MDGTKSTSTRWNTALARKGRLEVRPRLPTVQEASPKGTQPLELRDRRDVFLHVPERYQAGVPAPLVVMLHGAGGDADQGLGLLRQLADTHGFLLLVPESRGSSWDVIADDYGPDVALIDQALAWVFERYAVDPARIAVGGFSDGASYALSLGVANGDLFTHVLAFSPGFMAPREQHGEPRLFISHGIHDRVLPIDVCSRRLVPRVQRAGYDVLYREFDGPHTVPGELAREAVEWFTASR